MLKNFFKIATRNLAKNKAFSLINITGLAVGMASAILILLWIQSELSYDQFHEKRDRIYEGWNRAVFSGKLQSWNTTPTAMAAAVQKDFPEVERTVRVNWPSHYLFTAGENRLTREGNIVDSGFLQMFSFPLLQGDPKTCLNDIHSIVLTEKFAKSLFGDENAMGKVIKIDNKDNFTVTGVLKDLPDNTRFKFEYLLPWAYRRSWAFDTETNWGNNSTRTYVLLKPNTTLASIAPKVRDLRRKYDPEDKEGEMFLYPMKKWRLYSSFEKGVEEGGRIVFVRLFGVIAAFILLIACINFMNLSTARSEKRAKEVGIRKTVGANKGSLIGQFIGESVMISLIAGILALIIVVLSLPAFNKLTEKILFIDWSSVPFWMKALGFVLFTGVLAGSYPAFYLSSFQPVKVLKGTFRPVKALVTPRKVLVIIQFSFAILLTIATIIVKQQIDYAQKRESGYDRNDLIYHFLTGNLDKNYQLVKNELMSNGIANSVTKCSAPITQGWSDTWGVQWPGKDPNDKTDFDMYCADESIVKTAGFKLVSGRDFDLKQFPTDSNAMILNESAVKAMNFKQPLGQTLKNNDQNWTVIGVIKDFILQSPYQPMKPMVIMGAKGWFNVMHIKFNHTRTTAENLKAAEAIFKKYNPEYPFEYNFVDEEYARKFNDEKKTGTLAALFAGLTIFISCLGLFGLATYMAENRIKEIAVRKVLGATVTGIASLLSKDFLKLVFVSILIATPIAWWGMHAWLKDFPYHVPIRWWVFLLSGLLALLIALATISFQAVRAGLQNPVRSLRSE